MSYGRRAGPADICPGGEFFDAAGRLRRTCVHCGKVIPRRFGVSRYCDKRCKRLSPTMHVRLEGPKMAGDTAYPYLGWVAWLGGRRVRRLRVRCGGGGGGGEANGTKRRRD